MISGVGGGKICEATLGLWYYLHSRDVGPLANEGLIACAFCMAGPLVNK